MRAGGPSKAFSCFMLATSNKQDNIFRSRATWINNCRWKSNSLVVNVTQEATFVDCLLFIVY